MTALVLGALLCARAASAQTPAAAPAAPVPAASPMAGRMFVGGVAGLGAVQNIGSALGAEIAFSVTDMIDVVGEATWMSDVVTRRRLDLAKTVASFLGSTAAATIKAPATYGGAAARITFMTSGRLRPYATIGAGLAQVTYTPTFTLGGSDITATLSTYGVTIGRDMTEQVRKPAITGGIGVRILDSRWYIDAGLRVTSIQTDGQATNVLRAGVGVGVRF